MTGKQNCTHTSADLGYEECRGRQVGLYLSDNPLKYTYACLRWIDEQDIFYNETYERSSLRKRTCLVANTQQEWLYATSFDKPPRQNLHQIDYYSRNSKTKILL